MSTISQENAYIFRITHIDNVPWLLANGIHCHNSRVRDPNFREIGSPDLIDKRSHRLVPIDPGGTLSDYVPFYFTHYSPMLYNIKTGYKGMRQTPMSEIVILASTLHRVADSGLQFVFTDRHAYLQACQFKSDCKDLNIIDWSILIAKDFRRDPNDSGKLERYQAEALVHHFVPVSTLLGIACYDLQAERRLSGMLETAGESLKIVVKPDWFF